MEPYTHIDTSRPYLSSDNGEDGNEGDDAFRSSIDFLSVDRICHVQTAENRFGPDVGPDIRSFVYEPWHNFDIDDEVSDDSDNTEDELSDEIDDIELNEQDLGFGAIPDMAATVATMAPPQIPIGLQAPGVPNDLLAQLQLLQQLSQQQQQQFQQLQQQFQQFQQQGQQLLQQLQQREEGEGQQRFPRAQRLRLNLTALSQKYNVRISATW
ncbi:hypothetical protein N0V85_001057 [Neurospora sp. IMI 360204]|nr:hypothetical protein N0V85_001057 [Neurospora sp. IMI 360204]